jgi:hypothetical protein
MGVFNNPEARVGALDFMQKLAVNLKDKDKVSNTPCDIKYFLIGRQLNSHSHSLWLIQRLCWSQ